MYDMALEIRDRLTETNFIMYAMKNYQNSNCLDIDEFYDDLKRIKYLKRLFNRYKSTGILKERLILNHIIILYNVFGIEAATKILFFKLTPEFWPQLKTFLVYLHFMPEYINGIYHKDILSTDIELDYNIIKFLRQI